VRRHLFRAGHAHAGVWIVFALVGPLYVDQTDLSDGWRALVRLGSAIAPILVPSGVFSRSSAPTASPTACWG
jgi:hypothetical protein